MRTEGCSVSPDKETEELFGYVERDRRHQAPAQRQPACPRVLKRQPDTMMKKGEESMAISIRKLPPEEAQRVFPRRGQQDLSEYVAALRDIKPGEAAGTDRQGLSDRAIKRRLGQAAKSLGYRLKWSRQSSPEELYLQVLGSPRAQATNGRRRRRTASVEVAPATQPAARRAKRGRRSRAA